MTDQKTAVLGADDYDARDLASRLGEHLRSVAEASNRMSIDTRDLLEELDEAREAWGFTESTPI